MTKYLLMLIFALLSTNCFAHNYWICADQIKESGCELEKIQVYNGWIVKVNEGYSHNYFFVYDQDHRWK